MSICMCGYVGVGVGLHVLTCGRENLQYEIFSLCKTEGV